MSKTLFGARRKIGQVGQLAKQGNLSNAVQSLFYGVQTMVSESLLKSEKDDFVRLIEDAANTLNANKRLREELAMHITYSPGNERALLEELRMIMDTLDSAALDEADKLFKEKQKRKEAMLKQGVDALDADKPDEAKRLFNQLADEFPSDAALYVDMAEAYEKAGMLTDACFFLDKAAALDPSSAFIKNKQGILLRKLKRFDESEQAFLAAANIVPDDPNLFFNLGRLYVDWADWPKAADAGAKVLALDPGFEEAAKLVSYAQKRI